MGADCLGCRIETVLGTAGDDDVGPHLGKGQGHGPAKAAARENSPIILKRLKVARPPNTYLLLVSYRSADPALAADVANAVSQSYIMHT